MQSSQINNERLERLRKRQAVLRDQVAQELVRAQKRAENERRRTASVLGECLLVDLETNPQLGLLIEESLKRYASPRDAEFLRARGWRI